ncbi:MAG TPA: type III pantothenate kinase [Rhodocyclaceae bacterium]|nr:type III pantothenate kinase [Rhodocyclaceae bacterium]HRQ47652.1 type III pantothenate kinase [Rhodocyclaceae bacterium]
MFLLIDAGNTRVKWGIAEHGRWLAQGAVLHEQLDTLRELPDTYPGVSRILGANVAGGEVGVRIGDMLRPLAPRPEWLQASAQCCGVRNLYETPAQLGADRWAALIGARAIHSATCLVVNAGTATTVDLLDAEGCFQGGLILPGEALMRQSLYRNTAQLPLAEGHFRIAPRNTADAIVSGCLTAQVGAIERVFQQCGHDPQALCLLNGGAAPQIEPLLTIPLRRVDNLVLDGLATIAGAFPCAIAAESGTLR